MLDRVRWDEGGVIEANIGSLGDPNKDSIQLVLRLIACPHCKVHLYIEWPRQVVANTLPRLLPRLTISAYQVKQVFGKSTRPQIASVRDDTSIRKNMPRKFLHTIMPMCRTHS